jgi:hypothetical protein
MRAFTSDGLTPGRANVAGVSLLLSEAGLYGSYRTDFRSIKRNSALAYFFKSARIAAITPTTVIPAIASSSLMVSNR